MKTRLWSVLVLGAALIAVGILKKRPMYVEQFYSRGIYPKIAGFFNHASSGVGFSWFETILVVMVGAALFLGALFLRKLLMFSSAPVSWVKAGLTGVVAVLSLVLLFDLQWGLNYYRLPLADQLGLKVRESSNEELAKLCAFLIEDANGLSDRVPRNPNGQMDSRESVQTILKRVPEAFSNPLYKVEPSPPKAASLSWAMSWLGISGIYSPFTAEAHVNDLIPVSILPAVALHEAAHLQGFAREDEANFLAWRLSREYKEADFRYSGDLLAVIYAMNALAAADFERYQALKATYSPGLKADITAQREFWDRYQGQAEKIHEKINDQYLKANSQTDGVASYGRMVDLLLAYNRDALEVR